jgi:hypothetical protein
MTTGLDCVRYLEERFTDLDIIESWQRSSVPASRVNGRNQGMPMSPSVRMFEARMNALRKTGNLTTEEGFKAMEWMRAHVGNARIRA